MLHSNKSEALRRMASGIAHELNNICTAIAGNLQIIEHQNPPREVVLEIISDVLRTVAQGVALARRLQAFSGQQPLYPELFDLRDVVQSVSEEPFLQGTAVSRDLPQVPYTAFLDKNRIREMLVAIAGNARAATRDGGAISFGMDVDSQRTDGGPNGVHLRICDDGRGMTPDEIENAFDPMFTTRKPARASSGWGLSMASGLVRQMGGEIALERRAAGGMCVAIYLPTPALLPNEK
ncbi:MAG TPA: HAMP domain-containing sensor histidine kinase [Rhizomicrobium sp.]|jgi:signal transduction histidine kinase